jgi:hypothetical protein
MLVTKSHLTALNEEVEYKIVTQDGLKLTVIATHVTMSDSRGFLFYNGKKFIMFVDSPKIVSAQ